MPHSGLGVVSDHLFGVAIVAYSLAMFAFAVEFAFGRRGPVAVRSAVPAARTAEVPALVGAGAGPGSISPVLPAPPQVPPPKVNPRRARRARLAERFGRAGLVITAIGWLIHLTEVVTRGVAAGRVPWGNMYEFSSAVALVAVGGFLFLSWRWGIRWLGFFVLLPVVAYLALAGTVLFVQAGPLVPALNSYWLRIHVVAAITATGTFMVAGVVSLLHLVRRRHEAAGSFGFARRLPAAAVLDRTEYRIISLAFPLWTFVLISGAIWAERAWGRYWGWDPKETWSFITWVVYAAYLHARSTAGWRRASPWLALLGFAVLLTNYYVVNLVFNGLHAYSGV